MIWEKVSGRSTKWVSEQNANGPEINIDTEKNEIMRLINELNTNPSFNEGVIEVNAYYEELRSSFHKNKKGVNEKE